MQLSNSCLPYLFCSLTSTASYGLASAVQREGPWAVGLPCTVKVTTSIWIGYGIIECRGPVLSSAAPDLYKCNIFFSFSFSLLLFLFLILFLLYLLPVGGDGAPDFQGFFPGVWLRDVSYITFIQGCVCTRAFSWLRCSWEGGSNCDSVLFVVLKHDQLYRSQ